MAYVPVSRAVTDRFRGVIELRMAVNKAVSGWGGFWGELQVLRIVNICGPKRSLVLTGSQCGGLSVSVRSSVLRLSSWLLFIYF